MRNNRSLLRTVGFGLAVVVSVFIGFSVWLWNWYPPALHASDRMIKTTLEQAIHHTRETDTYPDLTSFGIKLVRPDPSSPHVSSDTTVRRAYSKLNGYWYSGTVEMYYGKVIGGMESGRTVWIIEDHLSFPRSTPAVLSNWWNWHSWESRYRSLLNTIHGEKLEATTLTFYDANTAKVLSAMSWVNFVKAGL